MTNDPEVEALNELLVVAQKFAEFSEELKKSLPPPPLKGVDEEETSDLESLESLSNLSR